jgi:hypothetical protein
VPITFAKRVSRGKHLSDKPVSAYIMALMSN